MLSLFYPCKAGRCIPQLTYFKAVEIRRELRLNYKLQSKLIFTDRKQREKKLVIMNIGLNNTHTKLSFIVNDAGILLEDTYIWSTNQVLYSSIEGIEDFLGYPMYWMYLSLFVWTHP